MGLSFVLLLSIVLAFIIEHSICGRHSLKFKLPIFRYVIFLVIFFYKNIFALKKKTNFAELVKKEKFNSKITLILIDKLSI